MSQSEDKKSARKFFWIIMILPLGLLVGTILSVINHLDHDKKEKEHNQFKVAVALNADDIKTGMERSLLIGERSETTEFGRKNTQTVRLFLQGSVSPAGSGLIFTEKRALSVNGDAPFVSYVDIPGINEDEILLVVIELVDKKSKGDASKLGLTPSLIRSLIDEKPLKTIRFVFTPTTRSAEEHANALSELTLKKKNKLAKVIVLKTQPEVAISDLNDWKHLTASTEHIEITHPALHATEIEVITDAHLAATLKATNQLRTLLLKEAN